MSKTIDSKTKEAIERGREELQNPDMAKFDRAMHALVKTTSNGKKARTEKPSE